MSRSSKFPPESREQVVELAAATGRTIVRVAHDLKIDDTTPGGWITAERAEPDSTGVVTTV